MKKRAFFAKIRLTFEPKNRVKILVFLITLASFAMRPVLSGIQDAGVYLGFMREFLEHGLRAEIFREPLYPLFLAALSYINLDPVIWIAPIQNLFFVLSLFFLMQSLFIKQKSSRTNLELTLWITAVPTFWFTMNGSLYTESLSSTLIFILIGSLVRSTKNFVWYIPALLSSTLLTLNKGSFLYIHLCFAPISFLALYFLKYENKQNKKKQLRNATAFGIILLSFFAFNRAAISLWFGLRPGEPTFSNKIYQRGGALLYGRIAYAEQFNFLKDSPPFFLNALSETACHLILGDSTCAKYTWDAEGTLGWTQLRETSSEEALFSRAIEKSIHSPFRQLIFMGYEWSRFLLHHSANGFAQLVEPFSIGGPPKILLNLVLKIFNIALWFGLIVSFMKNGRVIFSKLEDNAKIGFILIGAYSVSLLLTHGFVPTLVRMCFPIAPFLVLWNIIFYWEPILQRRKQS